MKSRINAENLDISVDDLWLRYKTNRLNVSPDFQRNFVWDKKKASVLIESLLLNIPIPSIFTSGTEEVEEVIDGQQRLTSIFCYIDEKWIDGKVFKCAPGLEVLGEELANKRFRDLKEEYQQLIKNYKFRIVRVNDQSDDTLKYRMFERLNTQTVKLYDQEIRNCVFRGPYNAFLKECAAEYDFQYIINSPARRVRMKDVEDVLVFFAFYHNNLRSYTSNKQFLDNEMHLNNNISYNETIKRRELFRKTVSMVKTIWGEAAFVPYSSRTTQFNQALYQTIMIGLARYRKEQIIPHIDLIREEMYNLQVHDQKFSESLHRGTNTQALINYRIKTWEETLEGILGYPYNEPRSFSYQLKNKLFQQNKTCSLCGQHILSIDDAEVDHIECYWKGGKTIPENAQLTHRICNRIKGGEHKKIKTTAKTSSTFKDSNTESDNNNLIDKLIDYRDRYIASEYSNLDETILSDDMILQIIQYKPTNLEEFHEIPEEYRERIKMKQVRKYIEDIIDIVSENI
uniref:HRDC domain-containing protein n=1 Tax=Desulfovibrio sp. U5L TaxID=596152 RepID=I2PWW5_9BACT